MKRKLTWISRFLSTLQEEEENDGINKNRKNRITTAAYCNTNNVDQTNDRIWHIKDKTRITKTTKVMFCKILSTGKKSKILTSNTSILSDEG